MLKAAAALADHAIKEAEAAAAQEAALAAMAAKAAADDAARDEAKRQAKREEKQATRTTHLRTYLRLVLSHLALLRSAWVFTPGSCIVLKSESHLIGPACT